MNGIRLKSFAPRSLIGRTALILLVPIVTVQLVVTYIFVQRLYENVTRQLVYGTLLGVNQLVEVIEAAPDFETAEGLIAERAADLELIMRLGQPGPEETMRLWYDVSGRIVIHEVNRLVPRVSAIDLKTVDNRVNFGIVTSHGPVEIDFSRRRASASNPHQLLWFMVAISILVTGISFVFLRNQVRPIKRLAEAAEAFGKGRVLPYKPAGATEVRSAGQRFLDMRARIERHIEQRTLMLSGVSHDLRTPLTRLKLGLSMLEKDAEVEALEADVSEMERMLESFLEFARSQAVEEPIMADPRQILHDLFERAKRAGQPVELGKVVGQGEVNVRPLAMDRALENLIGNAVRYGDSARVSATISDKAAVFTVEDRGPGIPAHRREEAIKPFSRLDAARNQNKRSGVGLGLAIANDVARQHGGQLRLGESAELGGLKAELVLSR